MLRLGKFKKILTMKNFKKAKLARNTDLASVEQDVIEKKKKKNYKVTLAIMITKLIDISTSCQHFHNNMRIECGSLSPKLNWHMSKRREEFTGSCLKQDKVVFTPSNVVNLLIAYELDTWARDLNTYFTLKDCLLGTVKLTKRVD